MLTGDVIDAETALRIGLVDRISAPDELGDTVAGVPVLVTHDPVDAYALADRVVILEDGRVRQAGTLTSAA